MQKRKKIISLALWGMLLGSFWGCNQDDESATDEGPVIRYEMSNEIFPNPERGFLHLSTVRSEGTSLNQTLLESYQAASITLVQRLYYLENFRNGPLSAAQLSLINDDMEKIRAAGLKAVLRFAYTDQMNGADAPLAVVEQHLDQLKPVFEDHQDVIAFVQAGFIGAWGEGHSSSNNLGTPENQKKVVFKILRVLPSPIMVQVRTPLMKQNIFGTVNPVGADIAYSADNRARVGHHNDCFLSGGTNYGTYTNITADKAYISNEALYVPTGGETCPPQAGYDPTCPEGRNEMKLLKWTYLNLDYYQPTLNAWRTSGCFDEFQRSLGYRLALVRAGLAAEGTAGGSYPLKIEITNKGYAPVYNPKRTFLVLKNTASGTAYEFPLDADVRKAKPGGTLTIDESVTLSGVPAGTYGLYLKIADGFVSLQNRPEYSIRLANTGTWVEAEGLNNLNHQLVVR